METGRTASKYPSASSILVVDDERASAELAATLLRSQGFQVRIASSGREGLELLARGGIDMLLLDLMMSQLDGVEVCAHVRQELRDPFLPIIITTSLHDRESRIRAKEAGADDVLVKPLDGLELLVRIDSLLRARSAALGLMRERDSLREQLAAARARIRAQEPALHAAAIAGATLRRLLDEQHALSELTGGGRSSVAAMQEQLHDFVQLASAVERAADGATPMTGVVRASERVEPRDVADTRLPSRAYSSD